MDHPIDHVIDEKGRTRYWVKITMDGRLRRVTAGMAKISFTRIVEPDNLNLEMV